MPSTLTALCPHTTQNGSECRIQRALGLPLERWSNRSWTSGTKWVSMPATRGQKTASGTASLSRSPWGKAVLTRHRVCLGEAQARGNVILWSRDATLTERWKCVLVALLTLTLKELGAFKCMAESTLSSYMILLNILEWIWHGRRFIMGYLICACHTWLVNRHFNYAETKF